MGTIDVPKFSVLSDHYERSGAGLEESDLFSLERRLGPMFDILRHKDTAAPLAMAVFGHAGTGKTTALRWLERRVSAWNEMAVDEREGHPRVRVSWFSAGEFPERNTVVARLLETIVLDALRDLPDAAREKMAKAALEKCAPCLTPSFVARLRLLTADWDARDLAFERASGTAVDAHATYDACLSFLAEWERLWLESGEPARIVVVLDDLDHCPPEVMMEVFNAMVYKLRSSGVIFVAGLDQHIARNVIHRHFKEHGYSEERSRHYLGKIFQVECHIEPSLDQLHRYYAEQVELIGRKSGRLLKTHLDEKSRGNFETAIMHLSGQNPRKIKLLLNSALPRAHSAARDASEADASRYFQQNLQAYLLQRWFSHFSVGPAALFRSDVREWLGWISREAAKPGATYSEFINTWSGVSESMSGSDRYGYSRKSVAPEGMSFGMIHEWVWELLKIPFEVEIFESDVETRLEDASSEQGASALALPNALKDALAAALEKPAGELTAGDVAGATALDLSGLALNEEDLAGLAAFENLERLELGNSPVRDIAPLAALKKLRSLNLARANVERFEPLGELVNLRSLDLSCTTISDLRPLAALRELSNLVLYGASVKELDGVLELPKLERLNLSQTEVEDADLNGVENLPSLSRVYLSGTRVSRKKAVILNVTTNGVLQVET